MDCGTCKLPSCNLGNIKFKTLRMYAPVKIILGGKRIEDISSMYHFRWVFLVPHLLDLSATCGASGHFLLPEALSSCNVWDWLFLTSPFIFLSVRHCVSPYLFSCLLDITALWVLPAAFSSLPAHSHLPLIYFGAYIMNSQISFFGLELSPKC